MQAPLLRPSSNALQLRCSTAYSTSLRVHRLSRGFHSRHCFLNVIFCFSTNNKSQAPMSPHPLASIPPPLPTGWTEHVGEIPRHPQSAPVSPTNMFLKQVLPARYTFSTQLPESPPMFDPCPHFLLLHPRRKSQRLRLPFLGQTGLE